MRLDVEYLPPLGATKKSKLALQPNDLALLARVRTNRQGRAVLGVVAQQLRRAYEVVEEMPRITQPGTGELAKGWKQTLDQTNAYAQKTYAALPDNDEPLTDKNLKRVAESLREARASLAEIGDQAADIDRGLTGTLADALRDLLLPPWLRPKNPKPLIFYVGIATAGVVGLFIVGKLLHKVMLGATNSFNQQDLLQAEREAVRAVEKRRLGRKQPSV